VPPRFAHALNSAFCSSFKLTGAAFLIQLQTLGR